MASGPVGSSASSLAVMGRGDKILSKPLAKYLSNMFPLRMGNYLPLKRKSVTHTLKTTSFLLFSCSQNFLTTLPPLRFTVTVVRKSQKCEVVCE